MQIDIEYYVQRSGRCCLTISWLSLRETTITLRIFNECLMIFLETSENRLKEKSYFLIYFLRNVILK